MGAEKIRVLHIITRLDPGGSAENTVLSVERVNPERFNSRVWTGPGLLGHGPPDSYCERIGERVDVEPHLVRPIHLATDVQALFDLTRHLRHAKPDILHLHSAKAGALGRVASRLARLDARVVYTPHGHVFSGYGRSFANRVFTTVEKALAPRTDAIVALTSDEIRTFLKHHAGHPSQFCVIPSGVDLSPYIAAGPGRGKARGELGVGPDEPLIGFVGRFEEVKGPDLAVEILHHVLRRHPNARALMIGDGAMKASLVQRVQDLGLKDRILFTGWREDIPHLMAAMDVFLLSSRNEGQGRVLVEAMAVGLPVVAMRSGGVGEVVEQGETGLLVEPGDLPAASETLFSLLEDPAMRESLGKHGQERALERYSVDEMIRRLEILYSGLLEDKLPAELLPQR